MDKNFSGDATYTAVVYRQNMPIPVGDLSTREYNLSGNVIYFDRYINADASVYVKLGRVTNPWIKMVPGMSITRPFSKFWITARYAAGSNTAVSRLEALFYVSEGIFQIDKPAPVCAFGGQFVAWTAFEIPALGNAIRIKDLLNISGGMENGGLLRIRNVGTNLQDVYVFSSLAYALNGAPSFRILKGEIQDFPVKGNIDTWYLSSADVFSTEYIDIMLGPVNVDYSSFEAALEGNLV